MRCNIAVSLMNNATMPDPIPAPLRCIRLSFGAATDGDPQQHLSGSWSLIQIPGGNNRFDSLRVAAFWIYLRQDAQMAERHARTTIINLDDCQFQSGYDISATAATADEVWANRVSWIYAHILNFCFGPEEQRTQTLCDFYSDKLEQWKGRLPSSFQPLFYKHAADEPRTVFPQEWFLSECHGNL